MGESSAELLRGTIDLLVLRTLSLAPMHGWGITQRIQQLTDGVLDVNQGSLYPALQRLEQKEWIDSEWRTTENNRRASPITLAQLFGDSNADAPHGEFITFPPNFDAGGWHVHTNTVNLVVLKGAYIYRDENGERRVGVGEFIRIPGGHRHWSGSDAKEGAVFYMHQEARMDQRPAQ